MVYPAQTEGEERFPRWDRTSKGIKGLRVVIKDRNKAQAEKGDPRSSFQVLPR